MIEIRVSAVVLACLYALCFGAVFSGGWNPIARFLALLTVGYMMGVFVRAAEEVAREKKG